MRHGFPFVAGPATSPTSLRGTTLLGSRLVSGVSPTLDVVAADRRRGMRRQAKKGRCEARGLLYRDRGQKRV